MISLGISHWWRVLKWCHCPLFYPKSSKSLNSRNLYSWKVEPTVGCTVVEHLNCTAHNGLWMDWRNNPNHSNGPGRVLCTSKKHHFCAYLGVLFIEIDSSFWKIFSKNFRGELPHIEIPSFAGWIQNMDARPQKFINYNRCIIGTVTTICYNSTKKKWIQTDKNFTSSVHFLISQ